MRRSRLSHDRQGCCGAAQVLGADGMLYQTTEDLLSVGHELNPAIEQFEASCFNGAPRHHARSRMHSAASGWPPAAALTYHPSTSW